MPLRLYHCLQFLALCVALLTASNSRALDFVWTGQDDDFWFTTNNWAPGEFGPPTTDDTATISNGDSVFVTRQFLANDQINALTLSGGSVLENRQSSLHLVGFEMIVDGGGSALTQLSGAGTELVVWRNTLGDAADGFDTDLMTINSGALVHLEAGRLEVDSGLLEVNSGAILQGWGWIDLEAGGASPFLVLNNNGLLRVSHRGIVSADEPLPLIITVTNANGRINLDGSSDNGVVDITQSGQLIINGTLNDAFDGDIDMASNTLLDISSNWINGTGGIIDIDAQSVSIEAPVATIRGGHLTNNGTINVNSGTLVLESNYTDDGSAINVVGTSLRTEATAVFNSPNFNGDYHLTVGGSSNVTINSGAFNWDGNGNAITTVEEGGLLTINATSIESLDGALYIGGDLVVNLPMASDTWTLGNTDDTVMNSPNATIDGSSTLVNSANNTIRGTGLIGLDMTNLGQVIAENGELRFLQNTVTNSGTVTIAANGSLFMSTNSLLVGGTLYGVDGARIDGGGTGTLQDLTVTGTIRQEVGTTRLAGTITNNGVITYVNSASSSDEHLRVDATATLAGNGALVMNSADAFLSGSGTLTNGAGHTVRGNGVITVEFINSGILRPEGLITLTGDYEQTPSGLLEIPVRGLTPGSEHGQLSVSGTAFLDGGLRVVFESGFVPQEDDEVQFLTAATVTGDFSYRSFPNLTAVAPDLAVQLLRDMAGDLTGRMRFIGPSPNPLGMNIPDPDDPNFMNPANYDNGAPQSSHQVVLRNLTGVTRTIVAEEDAMFANSANPFVHSLTIGGAGSVAPLVFEHHASSTISATAGVTVDALGVYDFQGGSLFTSKLEVRGAGTLSGSGQIVADLLVGTAGAGDDALFDPGGVGIGTVSIDGQYQQGPVGWMAVDITGPSGGANHDKITVSDDVTLAGRINFFVDQLSTAEFVPGAGYDIIETLGNVTGEFERIDVIGRDDIYFSIDYGAAPAAGSGAMDSFVTRVTASGWLRGDGTQDGPIDHSDALVLAAVLVHGNPSAVPCGDGCLAVANFLDAYDFVDTTPDDTRVVDFHDVPFFAQAMAQSQGTSLAAALESIDQAIATVYSWGSVPEPGSCVLLLAGTVVWLGACRRRLRRVGD